MTLAEVVARWVLRRDDYKRVRASIDGELVCEQFLTDLSQVEASRLEPTLNLREAARRTGYSEDHLGRLVREGKVPNAGRLHAPRVRLSEIPAKEATLRNSLSGIILSPTDIARAVVTQHEGGTR